MPLFGSKFSPKKTPHRKSSVNVNSDKLLEDLVGDQRLVKINLNGQELIFENGEWIPSSGKNSSTHKLNQKLRKKLAELQEENNLLKVKYELVLNMLTQATAESQVMERELEVLKKSSRIKSPYK
ncbi:protein chibby homolog 1-like [Anthonomus grandis grandis]|uniref:protein chibby homolog 1-like n=1 Tax=Anthonomus grandis grandis TaxID=2921223 RepID=UPI0021650610|nr:protein chibby homolog 1-like [Anthonomus grandis grandis]